VVTPSSNPRLAASWISFTLAVSRKNFMAVSFHIRMRNLCAQFDIGYSMKNSTWLQSSAGIRLFDRFQTTG
jgi:hypothetical protein